LKNSGKRSKFFGSTRRISSAISEISTNSSSFLLPSQPSLSILKLGWLGNKKDDEFVEISEIAEEILRVEPKNLLLFPEFFNDLFFYNKFKFFTILYKLGIVDNTTKRKYWALNSILMGFWEKR
jgi:hypothetical protein